MQEVTPIDLVRSLRVDAIEAQIQETEAELAALRQLLKVAACKEGKSEARTRRSASSGQERSPEQQRRVALLEKVLQDGPKTFDELKQLTGLARYMLIRPLSEGPFRKLGDKRWSLDTTQPS